MPLVYLGFLKLTADQRVALLSTLWYAVCMPVVFFGTLVEYHALFSLFMGIAFVCFSRAALRPSARSFLVLGLAVWLAQLSHASGLLLAPLFSFWYFFALGVIVPTAVQSGILVRLGINSNAVHSVGYVLQHRRTWTPGALDDVFVSEWLVPYLPLSLMVLLPLLRREAELLRLFWAFLCSFAIYFFFAFLLLIGNPEKGAYLIPVLLLCALIVSYAIRGPWLWKAGVPALAIMVTMSVAAVHEQSSERDRILQNIATQLRKETGGRPAIILLGAEAEAEACLIGLPEVMPFPLFYHCHEDEGFSRILPELSAVLEAAAETGRRVYLTEVGKLFLEQPKSFSPKFELKAKRLHEWLFARYELEAAPAGTAVLLHALHAKRD